MNANFRFWHVAIVSALLMGLTGVAVAQGPVPQDQPTATLESAASPQLAQTLLGTAITYQGQLLQASVPVTDTCDFQFGLWDAAGSGSPPTGGAQIGATQTKMGVVVIRGQFTIPDLDFGGGAFTGDARWLQIAVKCTGDANYTTLAPRQALTPAPYALALPGLWTQQNTTSPNIIGGYAGNWITPTAVGATIAGGGSLGVGNVNRVTSNYGTVSGGEGNTAGNVSTVSGGYSNDASGFAATVSGGRANIASINYATVGGGNVNRANGMASTIGGGLGNGLSGDYATIGGGRYISVSGYYAAVAGGYYITVTGSFASVGGGANNIAGGRWSTIGGGIGNVANQNAATVGGGLYNTASGLYAAVLGGKSNTAQDDYATVGGGSNNVASGYYAVIEGGNFNTIHGDYSTVGGGENNIVTDTYSTIGGGQQNTASDDHATVGGGFGNIASAYYTTVGGGNNNIADGSYATVGGGNHNTANNTYAAVGGGSDNIAGSAATVSGGMSNNASGLDATIGGGWNNTVSGNWATVGGGNANVITATCGTIAGGDHNSVRGSHATIGGGLYNIASGDFATVPGGYYNEASGDLSTAAGTNALAAYHGCYVWSDDSWDPGDDTSTQAHCVADYSWVVRASGGVYFYTDPNFATGTHLAPGSGTWSSSSDRNLKENFTVVDKQDTLIRLARLPLTTWNYKAQGSTIKHIGPTAQDFYEAFGVGEDDLHISTVDADGVALAGIQGLYQLVQNQDTRISQLEAQNASLEKRVAALEARMNAGSASSVFGGWNVIGLALAGLVVGFVVSRRGGGR